jgi:hypothetical protein
LHCLPGGTLRAKCAQAALTATERRATVARQTPKKD